MPPLRRQGIEPITRSSDYRKVYDKGVKVVGRYYVLFHTTNEEGVTRVGITVSSKVGGAVIRNRAKRRTRQALIAALKDSSPKADMVVVALARIKDADYTALMDDLKRLIGRVRT